MSKKYQIDYDLIDFSGKDNSTPYSAVFLAEKHYDRLVMEAFYLPRQSVNLIRGFDFNNKRKELRFVVYREVSSNLVCCGTERLVTSFIVEEVTHPKKLEEIARAFLACRKTPTG